MDNEINIKKGEIIKSYGPWTSHNINLGGDIYTISEGLNYDTLKLRRVIQIMNDISGERYDSLKVLDLGSSEGLYAIELGLQGVEKAVGIEGREANLKKAEFAKEALQLKNIQFFQDDVRELSEARYGRFDIILCLGLLYHLDAPSAVGLLEKMHDMCDRFLVIDTHIALNGEEKVDHRGITYFGTKVKEFKKGMSKDEKSRRLWSAIGNEESFLFSSDSLLKILSDVGFTSVYECHLPFEYIKPADRLTLVAVKGKKVNLRTCPIINKLEEEGIKEVVLKNKVPSLAPEGNAFFSIMKRTTRRLAHLFYER